MKSKTKLNPMYLCRECVTNLSTKFETFFKQTLHSIIRSNSFLYFYLNKNLNIFYQIKVGLTKSFIGHYFILLF